MNFSRGHVMSSPYCQNQNRRRRGRTRKVEKRSWMWNRHQSRCALLVRSAQKGMFKGKILLLKPQLLEWPNRWSRWLYNWLLLPQLLMWTLWRMLNWENRNLQRSIFWRAVQVAILVFIETGGLAGTGKSGECSGQSVEQSTGIQKVKRESIKRRSGHPRKSGEKFSREEMERILAAMSASSDEGESGDARRSQSKNKRESSDIEEGEIVDLGCHVWWFKILMVLTFDTVVLSDTITILTLPWSLIELEISFCVHIENLLC